MSLYAINEESAREIAVNFLKQHYSVTRTERVALLEGVWQVETLVSPSDRKFNVKINAKTGWILGW